MVEQAAAVLFFVQMQLTSAYAYAVRLGPRNDLLVNGISLQAFAKPVLVSMLPDK
jgi:hypothetical protein